MSIFLDLQKQLPLLHRLFEEKTAQSQSQESVKPQDSLKGDFEARKEPTLLHTRGKFVKRKVLLSE